MATKTHVTLNYFEIFFKLIRLFFVDVFSCRDISVGIATGDGLDDRCSIPEEARFLFHSVQPVLGSTKLPIQWVTGADFPMANSVRA
jgi:hypothetical protein